MRQRQQAHTQASSQLDALLHQGADTRDPDDVDSAETVHLSLLVDQDTVAAAVFDAATANLRTLTATFESKEALAAVIERIHTQFDVDRVIISARNASALGLMTILKAVHSKTNRSTTITVRKHADFLYSRAMTEIASINFRGLMSEPSMSENELTRYLSSHFDFDNKILIRAAGALICCLKAEKVGNQLERNPAFFVANLAHVSLDGVMFIDNDSLHALQIFIKESHPSLAKGTGQAKEGLSIYGFLNRTFTRAGSIMLRRWMLTPLVNVGEIKERLDGVEFLMNIVNGELLESIRLHLRDFSDVNRIFTRIRTRCASWADWSKFDTSMSSFMSIQSKMNGCSDGDMPDVFRRTDSPQEIRHLSYLVENVIDFDESAREASVVVHSGVSEALDAARVKYADLDHVLTEVAYQIQESNPGLSSITVQYIPQVGYVVCCEAPTTLPDFVFQFQEDETTFYYKDSCCRDLDVSVGDIYGVLQDIQRDLLEELALAALEYEDSVFEMMRYIARLDCLAAFADVARTFNYVRPDVSTKDEFYVSQARHPLQELLVDRYIANDLCMSETQATLIVTGHNGSGKSVVLKMIGLLHFLTQIGAYVPAAEARIGVVAKIKTRIQSMESTTLSQSSFTLDCQQMSRMLNDTDLRSLLLIDEFGKGTADADGTALLVSSIQYLVEQTEASNRPRVVVTTHLLNSMRKSLFSGSGESCEDDNDTVREQAKADETIVWVKMASADDEDSDQPPRPMYELRPGVTSSSNALGCAASCGLPSSVVIRASDVLACAKAGRPISRPRTEAASSTRDSCEELITYFLSTGSWVEAPSATLSTLRGMNRMTEMESS